MAKKNKEPEVKTDKPSGTTRLPHGCKSNYQDRRYGNGVRVWNLGSKKATCTVCGEQKRTG